MTTISKNSNLVAVSRTIKGTAFVGVKNYENEQGEISNYTILVGANHERMMKKDLGKLITNKQKAFVKLLAKDYKIEVIQKAYDNVFASLEKRLLDEPAKELLRQQGDKTINASDAQKDAYHHISKGVKLHLETLEVHIVGYRMTKKVLKAIDYGKDSRRELTQVQDAIKSICNLKSHTYRTFKFKEADIKMQGFEL